MGGVESFDFVGLVVSIVGVVVLMEILFVREWDDFVLGWFVCWFNLYVCVERFVVIYDVYYDCVLRESLNFGEVCMFINNF